MNTAGQIHNCKEIQEQIIELLDNELSFEERDSILEEIEKCPDCEDFYFKLKKIKNLVSDKLGKKSCSDNIMGNIRAQINIHPN
jgi:RNA binding exosome subunit